MGPTSAPPFGPLELLPSTGQQTTPGQAVRVVLGKVHATDATTGIPVALPPEEGLAPLLADLQKHLAARGWLNRAMIHVADDGSFAGTESVGRGHTAITVEASHDGKKVAIRRFKLREE